MRFHGDRTNEKIIGCLSGGLVQMRLAALAGQGQGSLQHGVAASLGRVRPVRFMCMY